MPPILYLIDGHALAYRAYFALSAAGGDRFRTSKGEPTAGTYGFCSVLISILEKEKPEYLAVAFDTGKTFRDDIFADYKGTREKMPDDLRPQIERIREVVDSFDIPRLEKEGFEADDVLGSIASQAVEQGFGVKIITGDRDLLQLVTERVIVNLPGKSLAEARDYTARDVIEYLGVRPDQVVDYKALAGDTSDNIPGVPGIGVKTAVSLLEQYPHLDDIYAHLEEIPTRYRTKLEAGRDSAYLSYQLAKIRTDVDLVLRLEDARVHTMQVAKVEAIFRELEFKTLTARLRDMAKTLNIPAQGQQLTLFSTPITQIGTPPAYQPTVRLANDEASLRALVEELAAAPRIAFDTETTSTDPMRAGLVGISIATRPAEGWYIPVGHRGQQPQLPLAQVIEALRPAFSDPAKEKIGHNIKYDCIMLENAGLPVTPCSFDTMIAEWLVNPESRALGLKDMAEIYLGIQMTHIDELIGKGKNQITMDQVAIEQAAPYAVADAEVTYQLRDLLAEKLQKKSAARLMNEIEMPLVPVLTGMERAGILLNAQAYQRMSGELSQQMASLEERIYQSVGYAFNLNSTQQLSKALFETLKLQPPDRRKKTASGHYSTAAGVLEEMSHLHPVIDWVLEYRELAKLKSTYIDALPGQINPRTGRVHTSYNQTGSVTGRLASSEPNLQNIPTRTELGRQVRSGFIAAPGCQLLAVDYSQIELRIVAHMSNDEDMLAAFRAGQDIHAATAAAIYNVPLDAVNKDMRRHAKAINFGLIYGMSAFGLTRTTDLTLAEAEDFVSAYFNHFSGVKTYLDGIRRSAAREGYVETLLGRRRYFPNLSSQTNVNLRNREEREAINAPIQGTAADIIKLAMIQLAAALKTSGLKARLMLQVHDELILEVPQAELSQTAALVQQVMENAYPLSIPLATEAKVGADWGNLTPYSPSERGK
ncbi:MAG: DNA polymerase I [Chloroflexi bacterium]|nr:DNA polymerase I [Chloroflexota bacterium]